jgi:hypothetical protein
MRILLFIDLWDPRIGSSVREMYQHAEGPRELGHETGWRTVEGMQVYPTSNPATG